VDIKVEGVEEETSGSAREGGTYFGPGGGEGGGKEGRRWPKGERGGGSRGNY